MALVTETRESVSSMPVQMPAKMKASYPSSLSAASISAFMGALCSRALGLRLLLVDTKCMFTLHSEVNWAFSSYSKSVVHLAILILRKNMLIYNMVDRRIYGSRVLVSGKHFEMKQQVLCHPDRRRISSGSTGLPRPRVSSGRPLPNNRGNILASALRIRGGGSSDFEGGATCLESTTTVVAHDMGCDGGGYIKYVSALSKRPAYRPASRSRKTRCGLKKQSARWTRIASPMKYYNCRIHASFCQSITLTNQQELRTTLKASQATDTTRRR